jgi:cytochrome P450
VAEQQTEQGAGGGMDAMDPEMARNPQPVYKMMREAAPVMAVEGTGFVVSSRAAVDEVLRNPAIFTSTSAVDLKNKRPLIPLEIDPPQHKTYRKILDPLFAPQKMKPHEDAVARLVNERIDAFIDRDEIDFAKDFSIPFPSEVFLTLFGLPMADLPRFLKMKDGIIRPNYITGQPHGHPETDAYQKETADSIYDFFEQVLEERAADPRDDLLSTFLAWEVEGERLTREEIQDICFLFLIAGLDTVSASLDCMFSYLAAHPDRRHELVADEERIPRVVEELLRWETPVMAVPRAASEDTEIGGCPVPKGSQIICFLGAANVDDDDVPDAEIVRWDRDANRHLAFGGGVHRCLGSNLARLELRVALREWHRRIPDYQVKPGVQLEFTGGIRSTDTFPMVLRASV